MAMTLFTPMTAATTAMRNLAYTTEVVAAVALVAVLMFAVEAAEVDGEAETLPKLGRVLVLVLLQRMRLETGMTGETGRVSN